MPDKGALVNPLIESGIMYQDVVDNVHQLILEHVDSLGVLGDAQLPTMVVKYDEIKVYHTPFISVVFDQATVASQKIGNCQIIANEVTIYHYLQSLSFGNDTYPFLEPMYRLTEMFLVHWDLYGLAAGTGNNVQVVSSSLVGRRLESDTYLTQQLNLTVNVRGCRDGHT